MDKANEKKFKKMIILYKFNNNCFLSVTAIHSDREGIQLLWWFTQNYHILLVNPKIEIELKEE